MLKRYLICSALTVVFMASWAVDCCAAGYFPSVRTKLRRPGTASAKFKDKKSLAEALVESVAKGDVDAFTKVFNQGSLKLIDKLVAENEDFSNRRECLTALIKVMQDGMIEDFGFEDVSEVLNDKDKLDMVVKKFIEDSKDSNVFVQENGRWYFSLEALACPEEYKDKESLTKVLVEAVVKGDTEALTNVLNPASLKIFDKIAAENEDFSSRKEVLSAWIESMQEGILEEFGYEDISEVLSDKAKLDKVVKAFLKDNEAENVFVQENGRWYFSVESWIEDEEDGEDTEESSGGESEQAQYGKSDKIELVKAFLRAVYNDDADAFWMLLDDETREMIDEELKESEEFSDRKAFVAALSAMIRQEADKSIAEYGNLDIKAMLRNDEMTEQMAKGMLLAKETEKMFIQKGDRFYLSFAALAEENEDTGSEEKKVKVDYSSEKAIARSFIIGVLKGDENMLWECIAPEIRENLEQNFKKGTSSRHEVLEKVISGTRQEIKNDYSLKSLDGALEDEELIEACVENITSPGKKLFKKSAGKWYFDPRK